MRGLAFPSNGGNTSDRETSYEYGTPVGNSNIDDIPIDPALGGPSLEHVRSAEEVIVDEGQPQVIAFPDQEQLAQQRHQHYLAQQYSEGPQGDPFAPQPLPTYFPPEEFEPTPTPRPPKRKRKPRREEECSFCQGDDSKNKVDEPERMLTCDNCGRSGHPSCMELAEANEETLHSYPWTCIECKKCEICTEKGDDERILFCDSCDRGWHMDCLVPPIEEPPTGKWFCPACPPQELEVNGDFNPEPEQLQEPPPESSSPAQHRESSVASSSRSIARAADGTFKSKSKAKSKSKGKGKAKAPPPQPTDESEDLEIGPSTVRQGRVRRKSYKSGGGRHDGFPSDDDTPTPARQPKRARVRAESPVAPRTPAPAVHPLPRIRLRLSQKGKEREDDEAAKGMFDDILSAEHRDTTKSAIILADKQRFERSRIIADEKIAPPPPPPPRTSEPPDIDYSAFAGPSSRPTRSSTLQHVTTAAPSTSPAPSGSGTNAHNVNHGSTSGALRISTIRFGQFDIKTWYDAPFPEEYANIPDGRMWICEFCLKYMKSQFGAKRHRMKCKSRHPPGDEIYRDGAVSIFEVDGRKNKIYCQNLCLLSKMFLDHKSLFYDVEPFLFYVITECDDIGARFVGYFSKEKRSPKDYNVSCIMTLPVRQRQGWGNLLIDFSYLLSKKEQRLGSPEKPLSSLGALGYKNYWTLAVMRYLEAAPERPRLEDIAHATSLTLEDVFFTLAHLNMITTRPVTPPPIKPSPGQSIKYPKGRKNGVARRHLQRTFTNGDFNKSSASLSHSSTPNLKSEGTDDSPKGPFVPPESYEIKWDKERVKEYLERWDAKGYLRLRPEKLKWSPFLMQRGERVTLERVEKVQGVGNVAGVEGVKKTEADGAARVNELNTTAVVEREREREREQQLQHNKDQNGEEEKKENGVMNGVDSLFGDSIVGSPIAVDEPEPEPDSELPVIVEQREPETTSLPLPKPDTEEASEPAAHIEPASGLLHELADACAVQASDSPHTPLTAHAPHTPDPPRTPRRRRLRSQSTRSPSPPTSFLRTPIQAPEEDLPVVPEVQEETLPIPEQPLPDSPVSPVQAPASPASPVQLVGSPVSPVQSVESAQSPQPVPPKRPRGRPKKSLVMNDVPAAKPNHTLEEYNTPRQTRSRAVYGPSEVTVVEQDVKEVVHVAPRLMRRSMSARKLRRVDSSPEMEDSPLPPVQQSLPDVEEDAQMDETPVKGNAEAESNGHPTQPQLQHTVSFADDVPVVDVEMEPPDAGVEVNGVKADDGGARSSVPSDDTVFAVVDVHAAAKIVVDEKSAMDDLTDDDADGDEDADGEFDEDFEMQE